MRRPFPDTLRDLRGGETLNELEDKLQQLVHAVQATNGGGSISLVIEVKPAKGSSEAVIVTDHIKTKLPQVRAQGTLMFPTPEGNLSRQNPNQRELPGITLAAKTGTAS